MIKHLTAAVLGLAALLNLNSAHADYLVYTNRTSFESAITGEKTENFNELGSNTQSFIGMGLSQANGLTQPLTISGSNQFLLSSSASAAAGYYPTFGTYLIGPNSTSPTDGITVTLPGHSYTALGVDAVNFASNSVVSLLATTALGYTFTSTISVDGSNPNSTLGFLGVVVTTPGDYLTSLTFSAPVGSAQNVVIDNVSFGFAPLATVPEPASMALLVSGTLAIGIAALRKRFRTKAA